MKKSSAIVLLGLVAAGLYAYVKLANPKITMPSMPVYIPPPPPPPQLTYSVQVNNTLQQGGFTTMTAAQQDFASLQLTQPPGTVLTILDSNGNIIATYTVPPIVVTPPPPPPASPPPPVNTGTFNSPVWTTIADNGCTATIDSNGVAHTSCPATGSFLHAVVTRGVQASQIPTSTLIPGRYLHLSGKALSGTGTYYYNECSVYYQFNQTGLNPPLLDLEVQVTHVENGMLQPPQGYVGHGSDSVHGSYTAYRVVLSPPVQTGPFDYTIDLYQIFQQAIAALGLPASTTSKGVVHLEPGVEIFNGGPVSTDWYDCSLSGVWPT